MQWFLLRKDAFSYTILEYREGELLRKMSFSDSRGLPSLTLINEAKSGDIDQLSSVQLIIRECKPVKY